MRHLFYLFLSVTLIACSTTPVPVVPKFPKAPESYFEKCPDLKKTEPTEKLSEVLKTIVENYSLYHDCKSKQSDWIEWYSKQKEEYEKLNHNIPILSKITRH